MCAAGRSFLVFTASLLAVTVASACSNGDGPSNPDTSAPPVDADATVGSDIAADVDAAADVVADAQADAGADTATVVDVVADAAPDGDMTADTVSDAVADTVTDTGGGSSVLDCGWPDAGSPEVYDTIADTGPPKPFKDLCGVPIPGAATPGDDVYGGATGDAACNGKAFDTKWFFDKDIGLSVPTPDIHAKSDCPHAGKSFHNGSSCSGNKCNPSCPPGWPCVCGVCPWTKIPKMIRPRERAVSVWTGKEVLIFGGTSVGTFDDYYRGERWEPGSGKGWQPINVPHGDIFSGGGGGAAMWLGDRAFVYGTAVGSFFYFPDSDTWKTVHCPKDAVMSGASPSYQRAGHRIFTWGHAYKWVHIEGKKIGVPDPTRPQYGWFDPRENRWFAYPVPHHLFPTNYLLSTPNWSKWTPRCWAAWENDVWFFDVNPPTKYDGKCTWPGKVDPSKAISLHLHIPTNKWTVLPQNAPKGLRCGDSAGAGGDPTRVTAFPGGFVVFDRRHGYSDPPNLVAVYKHANKTWTTVADTAHMPTALGSWNRPVWTGKHLAFHSVTYSHGKTTSVVPPEPVFLDPVKARVVRPTQLGLPNHEYWKGNLLVAGDRIMVIGGRNGPPTVVVHHRDGIQLHLPSLLAGAVP